MKDKTREREGKLKIKGGRGEIENMRGFFMILFGNVITEQMQFSNEQEGEDFGVRA